MKSIVFFSLSFFIVFSIHAQSFNTEVTTGKQPVLLGKVNKDRLDSTPYNDWFSANYNSYQPIEATTNQIKDELSEYTIIAFLGTWCGDSKREVPRFYKVLEAANYPLDRLTTIAVSRDRETYKQSPGGEEEGHNIHRVPTFIFYKNGKEVNRIVESPRTTIENDILQILQQNYTPNYEAVTIANKYLEALGAAAFQKKTKKIAKQLSPKNMYELNTYSNVLFFANRKEDAIAIARLNTKLFPNEASAFKSLGNKLTQTNKIKEAVHVFEAALALSPKDETLQQTINQLKIEAGE